MGTLYDLLGALPGDDAESLRAAFRRAAKATHPDINPDDPDAALRFRELVRAYDILIDAGQRTTYDELLAIAGRAPPSKSAPVYETIRKFATNTIAATIIAAVLIGGYTLFGQHLSSAPGAAEIVRSATAGEPEAIAAAQTEASASNRPRVAEAAASTNATAAAAAIAPAVKDAAPAATGTIDLAASDARSHRDRALFAVREGDMYRALTNFDLAIRYDPGFAEAYVDRGVLLYRMRDFDRAFADMAQAKRITDSSKVRIPLPAPRKITPVREVREIRRPVRRWPMTAAITP